MPVPKIRVLCVDDHSIVREGISLIINQQPDMEVIAFASSGEESVDAFRRVRPDITLIDLRLQGMSGTEAIEQIRDADREARIGVLTCSTAMKTFIARCMQVQRPTC